MSNDFGEYFCQEVNLIRESKDSIDAPPVDNIVPESTAKLERFSLVSVEKLRDIIRSSSNASCLWILYPLG